MLLADRETRAADFLVEARGIFKRFGATEVLKGVDFAVRPGKVHALPGGNGAGESTLIKIITGALQRDAGVADHRRASEQPTGVINDVNGGMLIH